MAVALSPAEIRRTSWHEAGHAVAALASGFRVGRVRVVARAERYAGSCLIDYRLGPGDPRHADAAVVHVAGDVAGELAAQFGIPWWPVGLWADRPPEPDGEPEAGTPDDLLLGLARIELNYRAARTGERRRWTDEELRGVARLRAETVLLLRWPSVEALARALCSAGELAGRDATDIAGRALTYARASGWEPRPRSILFQVAS